MEFGIYFFGILKDMPTDKPDISANKNLALERWRNRKKKAQPQGIQRMPEGEDCPLSYGQQRLWFLQQLYPGNPFYNYSESYRLRGKLNTAHLIQGLEYVARRHDMLRTRFEVRDGQAIQLVEDTIQFEKADFDLQHLPELEREAAAQKIIFAEAEKSFELTAGPLTRITLIRLAENDHILALTMHHIITDKWSMRVLREELATAYQALQAGETLPNQSLKIQYADYAYWQRNQQVDEKHLAYWTKKLEGELPVLKLPTDRNLPVRPSFKGAYATQPLSLELSRQLKTLSQQSNTTLFVLLLTAYKVLLHRYSGQEDILVGTPFTNRDKKELEQLIGFFNDTLVLRSDLSDNPTFLEVVEQVRTTVLEGFSHKNTPFETLVKTLQPERSGRGNPLFQVMFLYHNVAPTPVFNADLDLQHEPFDLGVAKFDLTLYIAEDKEQLTAIFEYAKDLFDETTIDRMQAHLQTLLQGIVDNPKARIADLPILPAAERQLILQDWNSATFDTGSAQSIIELFEQQVREQPDKIAVIADGSQLNYQQLSEKVNAIAGRLRDMGIGSNIDEVLLRKSGGFKPTAFAKQVDSSNSVGLFVGRSTDMMAGILGIMKAGAAYVPLDPEYPAERIEFMLEDAAVSVVLTQEKLQERLPKTKAQILTFESIEYTGANIDYLPASADLAYIIYTSGSTGKPKGVPVTHKNLLHSTRARFEYYPKHPGCFLLMSSFSFDSSVAGIFWTMASGGALLIPERRIEQDTNRLAEIIAEHSVTHTLLLPSLYEVLLKYASQEKLSSLNTVMVAGEACPASLCDLHYDTLPDAILYNEYGPTEASVWCTVHEITRADARGAVPIGRPTANAEIYILNRNLQPVPIGVAGELYVGGSGVTQGYLNRPELTQTRFLNNPFSKNPDALIYHTGDLARFRANGVIEFLGRADQQVKIRGYRIEPDEIREVLKRHESVRDAVVTVQKNKKRLISYLIVNEGFEVSKLRLYTKQQLPDYMVPALMIELGELPRLPNGKVNLNALPEPKENELIEDRKQVAARTPNETQLVNIWQEVLNIKPISIHDNFFEIGGDSILSIQIIAKARKAGLKLTPQQLFEQQTIAELALFVQTATKETKDELIIGEVALTPIQHWFFKEHKTAPQHWNQSIQLRKSGGFKPSAFAKLDNQLNAGIIRQAVEHLILRHEALRLSFAQVAGEWTALILTPEKIRSFQQIDLTDVSTEEQNTFIQKEIAAVHEGFDLAKGSLFQAVYIQDLSELRLMAHHLIIDAVSWQIIIEELKLICQQLLDGKPIDLPAKTASYKDWCTDLNLMAKANTAKKELTFWQKQIKTSTGFPTDFEAHFPIEEKDIEHVLYELDLKKTEALLREVGQTYNTKTDEVLITAFMLAFAEYSGQENLCVGLERHGRDVNGELDVSGTVGWFTSFFPLQLVLDSSDKGTALKSIKEQIRAVPNSGIAYGLLHYINQEIEEAKPQVVFNYLGNQQAKEAGLLGVPKMLFEQARHPQSERSHLLEVNAFIEDGQLKMRWSYSQKIHQKESIERLVNKFERALDDLMIHCQNTAGSYTPSDFPEAAISQPTIDALLATVGGRRSAVAGIYPLSFMQQALLFHHLQETSDEGLLHVSCKLEGNLDYERLQQAWQKVVHRHSALRTAIRWTNIEKPVQFVLTDAKTDWVHKDWSDLDDLAFQTKLTTFKKEDIQHGLDLTSATVSRFALIKRPNQTYHLLWTCHHILLDGWSAVAILKDLIRHYDALCKNEVPILETIPSYSSYLSWQKRQDKEAAEAFWKKALDQFEHPALMGKVKRQDERGFGNQTFALSQDKSSAVQSYIKQQRITLNTLIQGIWSILLSAYTDKQDVVFGTSVSGRSADLPNMDLMAGLFMNVVPVRAKIQRKMSFSDWLRQVQSQQLEARNFDHVSLDQITDWAKLSGHIALFDSLIVFENFPWSDLVGGGVIVSDFKGGITTTYPVTIVVVPGEQLEFHIRYNKAQITEETINWLRSNLNSLFEKIHQNTSLESIQEQISTPSLLKQTIAGSAATQVQNYIAPQNEQEEQLSQIWEQLFGIKVSTQDDFFEIGGNSLLAVRLFSKIEEELGQNLLPVILLQHRTIAALARVMQQKNKAHDSDVLVPLRAEGNRPPLFCFHAAGGHIMFYKELADQLDANQPVYAVQPKGLDGGEIPYNSMEEMAAYYLKEIKKVQPQGPYFLLGVGAFEVVRQLRQVGEEIGILAIIDTAPPAFVYKSEGFKRIKKVWRFIQLGRWGSIQAILRRKLGFAPPKAEEKVLSPQEQNLKNVQDHLNQLLTNYNWKPQDIEIVFARSKEMVRRKDKTFHIPGWKRLATKGLDVFEIPVMHGELFEAEGAKVMARELQERINKFN